MYNRVKPYYWLFFFVHPLLTLVHYLRNFRKPFVKNILWAFSTFFAMTIAIGIESENSDIVRYMGDLRVMADINSWNSLIVYYHDSGEIDVFRILFSFILSRFTSNGYILLIFFGFIYGYFYSRNMMFVLDRIKGKLKFVNILLIFCLFLIVPIWDLGSFRFWTATHIFLFGLLPFLFTGKKKSLTWCYLTPFIFHYAYIIPLLVLILYLIVGNRLKVYFYLFVTSLLIGNVNIVQFNNLIEAHAPNAFVERSSSYRIEEKVEGYRSGGKSQGKVWYVRHLNKFIHWPLYIFLILLYWKSRYLFKKDPGLLRLLCFTLLFYSFANVFSSLPSGGRYLSPAGILATSFLVLYIQNINQEKYMTQAMKLAIPSLVIFVVVKMRMSWYFASVMTLVGNPLIALFNIGKNTSINDIIKYW